MNRNSKYHDAIQVKMLKESKEWLYFIQDDIKNIEKNILTISSKEINTLFNKIACYGNGLLEVYHLNALLIVIQEKKEYYHKKQTESCDNSTLRSIIICMIILGLSLYGLYIWWNDFLAKDHQLKLLINELKPYGITVKECSKRYYKHTKYWLEVASPTKDLALYQWVTAKRILEQIYTLHSTMHGKDYWIFLTICCGIFFSVKILFVKIRQWLNPRYKERYKKYIMLEDKIQHKIKNLPIQL
jgi:hypothetical protein